MVFEIGVTLPAENRPNGWVLAMQTPSTQQFWPHVKEASRRVLQEGQGRGLRRPQCLQAARTPGAVPDHPSRYALA